jgi:hypothetical protein
MANQTHFPSTKALIKAFGITKEQANKIRLAMQNEIGLMVADKIIHNTYGVEEICIPERKNIYQEPKFTIYYVNRGDTYTTTLMKVNDKYRIGNWGDLVERFDR